MSLARPRLWGAVAIVTLALGMLGAGAAASDGPSSGSGGVYGIVSASLTQDGRELVWSVSLAQPWAANRLAREHRSLCLLIERVASGVTWGQACVVGPRHGTAGPRLEYTAVSGAWSGPGRSVAATVARPSSSELQARFLPAAIGLRYGSIRWQTSSTLSGPGCAAGTGDGCAELSPAKPTLLKLHPPLLVGCVARGPSLVSEGSRSRREIALTFDDGPSSEPPTVQFLQVLEREHVPATFFVIGDQISTYDPGGRVERRMLADGDMIGDHTWDHPANLVKLKPAKQRHELLSTAGAIRSATHGFTPCLWRPPYGAVSRPLISLARSLGLLTVLWNVDPRDWSLPGVGAIYSNVVTNARSGSIVIEHFGGGPRLQTLAALPREIETLRARGYTFVTVSQLLGLAPLYR